MNIITTYGKEQSVAIANKFKANSCTYFTENPEAPYNENGIEYNPIYLYDDHVSYIKSMGRLRPLSQDEIEELSTFYEQSLDILYRWRSSFSKTSRHRDIKEVHFALLTYWNDYIINNSVDLLIMYVPHTPIHFTIYQLCKIKKIPILYQSNLPIIKGASLNILIETDIGALSRNFFRNYNKNLCNQEIENAEFDEGIISKYFGEYKKNSADIKRVIYQGKKTNFIKITKFSLKRAIIYIRQKRFNTLIKKMFFWFKANLETSIFLGKVEKMEIAPDMNKEYVYFPLHLQPEATTLPLGKSFVNQLLVINLISHTLPKDVVLYVKEHPAFWLIKERLESMLEFRDKEFYMHIINLPNVYLIKHDYDSFDLLKNSKAIATVTGTIAWEAAFIGKPVMIYGDVFYQHLPNCVRIKNIIDCQNFFNEFMPSYNYDEKKMIAFLRALEKEIAQVSFNDNDYEDINEFEMSEEEVYLRMADLFYRCYSNEHM